MFCIGARKWTVICSKYDPQIFVQEYTNKDVKEEMNEKYFTYKFLPYFRRNLVIVVYILSYRSRQNKFKQVYGGKEKNYSVPYCA
jgi:hypothetical protein